MASMDCYSKAAVERAMKDDSTRENARSNGGAD
jgi:hypothetical protein